MALDPTDRLPGLGMARGSFHRAGIVSIEEYRATRARLARFGDHVRPPRRLIRAGRPRMVAVLFDPPD